MWRVCKQDSSTHLTYLDAPFPSSQECPSCHCWATPFKPVPLTLPCLLWPSMQDNKVFSKHGIQRTTLGKLAPLPYEVLSLARVVYTPSACCLIGKVGLTSTLQWVMTNVKLEHSMWLANSSHYGSNDSIKTDHLGPNINARVIFKIFHKNQGMGLSHQTQQLSLFQSRRVVPSVNSSVARLWGQRDGHPEGGCKGIWVAGGELSRLRALVIYHAKE